MYVTFTHGTQILGIELDLVVYNYKDDSEEVTVYSNFNDGEAVYGAEETVKNYLILSKDPSGKFYKGEQQSLLLYVNLSITQSPVDG